MKGIREMQLFHDPSRVSSVFDEPNLVSCAGLAPGLALAGRAGLSDLVADTLTLIQPGGVNAVVKVPALVAGMVAGADSIDDMDLLRHGGMGRVFTGVRAPSTLGTFLRCFTFGHVRQLDKVAAGFLAGLVKNAPVLRDAGTVTYLDIDDTIKATHGYAKQGAGYGYSGVKGLNALVVTASTALSAPMIVATRLRKGSTNSARGAARLLAGGLSTAKSCGADPKKGALVITRADSAFYNHKVIGAARRHGSKFSVTARMTKTVTKAIAGISDDAWTPIQYPNAIWDEDEQRLISDAEVAEIGFTAFTSRKKKDQVTARLIVRRVKRLNPKGLTGDGKTAEQGELFDVWRYHAVFTDSPLSMLDAEAAHRQHAIIENVHADLRNGPLAHLPSGKFNANAAWLACAAIAFNLTRAAGALASPFHAKATGATIRAHLINVPARLARTGIKTTRPQTTGRLTLHLPTGWPWEQAWDQLFTATTRPPPIAA
jgi:hypothetical protein